MPAASRASVNYVRVCELLYLSLTAFSFYLLISARTGEAHTIWQVLNPVFLPTLFSATFLLFAILLKSEETVSKLLLTIIHSILVHSLFSLIFPAGDLSGQQMVLGRTRLVFDNTVLHGLTGWPTATTKVFLFELLNGTNFQAALSTIIARALSIDIFYVHLSLVPILWGVFIPIAAFLTTKAVGGSDKVSVLSSLFVSAFPYTIYFGAISVPNSLGFIFFFYSLYSTLRYLSSDNARTVYWMLAFSFFSLLSHYLTGIVSFSLIFLAIVFKTFRNRGKTSSREAQVMLLVSFIVCASLLPLSFICLRIFGSSTSSAFTLNRLNESSPEEVIGLFLLGDLIYSSDFQTVILVVSGPFLACIWMILNLRRLRRDPNSKFREHVFFLSAAFALVLIDYGILKVFMENLPLNAERLWVFRDFLAAPFAALAIYAGASFLGTLLRTEPIARRPSFGLKALPKYDSSRVAVLMLTLNILIPMLLAGWVTFSLVAAYPRVAPLQTTSYELEAVKYIDDNTEEGYVVICDVWTIYAGEMIVGISNPKAYYFGELNTTGHDLFANMRRDPSPQWMLLAMKYTDTRVAYFVVSEPRLGVEEFNLIVSSVLQNKQLRVAGIFGAQKLYVFSYRNGESV